MKGNTEEFQVRSLSATNVGAALGELDVLRDSQQWIAAAATALPGLRDPELLVTLNSRDIEVQWALARNDDEPDGTPAPIHVADTTTRLTITIRAQGSGGRRLSRSHRQFGGTLDDVDESIVARLATDLAAEAHLMKQRRDWGPGRQMAVVLAGGIGGTLVHEAVGHPLEADLANHGRSALGTLVGQHVAPSFLSVTDDASLAGLWGSAAFDDEGQATRPIALLRGGQVDELLHNRLSGGLTSCSGRRQAFDRSPSPRMSNTFVQPGPHDIADLLIGAEVLVCRSGGNGEVLPGSGEIILDVRHATIMRHGEIASEVGPLLLHADSQSILTNVEGVADDLQFVSASCIKGGQRVPVAHGSPTIRLGGILVTG